MAIEAINPAAVQWLAALLFLIGIAVVLTRRNLFFVLMGVELMLNAVNLSFVGFSRQVPGDQALAGNLAPLFVIAVAAAEACIGLAMVICLFRGEGTVDADRFAGRGEESAP
jgi:NADH:ubiquinone oxidoreductase subunit K